MGQSPDIACICMYQGLRQKEAQHLENCKLNTFKEVCGMCSRGHRLDMYICTCAWQKENVTYVNPLILG